ARLCAPRGRVDALTEGSVGWATIARGPRSGTRPASPSPYDEGVGRGPGRGAALCSVSHGPLLNVVVVPGQCGGRRVLRPVPTISQQIAQFFEGFIGGISNDPAMSHGQQTTMRFASPPGAGKHHPGVKDDLHAFSFDVP